LSGSYYYSFPPIQPGMNDKGNTFCTPGYLYADTNSNVHYGIKITAESGDKMILKRNKNLWITGRLVSGNYFGDTIHFKPGSILVLEPSAEIFLYNGGT
jgi:hypothetical protein